jgi:hypothetical protein
MPRIDRDRHQYGSGGDLRRRVAWCSRLYRLDVSETGCYDYPDLRADADWIDIGIGGWVCTREIPSLG